MKLPKGNKTKVMGVLSALTIVVALFAAPLTGLVDALTIVIDQTDCIGMCKEE